MKVVICGSPHSGKSVFIGGLQANLPRKLYYTFRACPDGEGSWTYRDKTTASLRRKGHFTPEFVEWCCAALSKPELAQITLVDVGGRMSQENALIMGKCTHAIILDNNVEMIEQWVTFAQKCGLQVIAKLHSNYNGQSDSIDGEVMSVHYLERGEQSVKQRPTIKKVAEIITNLTVAPDTYKGDNMIIINELAEAIGKKQEQITLPNGRIVSSIKWDGSDLPIISRYLHNAYMGQVVKIDGAAPAWLVAAITHELHPSEVELNSPDGYVRVGCQKPNHDFGGTNLEFVATREGSKLTVMCQQKDPSIPLSPADLWSVTPPDCQMGDIVVLSGRMPNWLTASLAMSYHGKAKAVACFQPGVGSTVCWTHSQDVALGSMI